MSVTHAKSALRATVRERRRALSEGQRQAAASALQERIDDLVTARSARTVSCYLSTPSEPGTRGFIAAAAERGIRVLLPVTRDDGLLGWAEPDAADHPLGIHAVNEADLMLIPAAAVDHSGMRLGWGRGYFDKTLDAMTTRPPVYAVVYDSEILDEVPREPHDQPVDGVITPERTLTFTPLT